MLADNFTFLGFFTIDESFKEKALIRELFLKLYDFIEKKINSICFLPITVAIRNVSKEFLKNMLAKKSQRDIN